MHYYKFLVCISSYKRPVHVLGQIHRFFKQSYNNFDISVVVRNCDENVNKVISNECAIYPKISSKNNSSTGLILSFDKNKDQLNNLLDCIRNADYSNYDFFCKIDDDDIYSLNYLENINKKLNEYNKVIGFRNRSKLQIIAEDRDMVRFTRSITSLYGNTLGFGKYMFEILDDMAKNKDNFVQTMIKHGYCLSNPNQYLMKCTLEDKFIDHSMMALQNQDNIYVDIELPDQLYYCKLVPGVVDIK